MTIAPATRDLTIFSSKDLIVGHTYSFTFAGDRYRGVCFFSGERDYKMRQPHAGGKLINYRRHFSDFRNCVKI